MAVAGGSTGSTASIPNVIQNDYVVVLVGFSGTGQSVLSGGVTDTAGSTFSNTGSSNVNQDTEIWCGQHTAASGSDTVTVKSTASATYSFTVYFLGGLSSCSGATIKTNSGSSSALSVASFTPVTGAACVGIGNEASGAAGAITFTQPNPFYYDNGNGAPSTSPAFAATHWAAALLRGSWNTNDGSTTATLTPSGGVSGNSWDEVLSCYPTMSAGNDAYNEGPRGGARGAVNNPGEGVNGVLKGDYIIQFTAVAGSAITVSSISDTNGGGDTWSKVGASDVHNDIEIWTALAAQTTVCCGFGVNDLLSGIPTASFVIGYDIGSITSTAAEVFTNSGTASTISLPAFTPNSGDLCLEAATTISGSGSTTFSVPANQPFQNLEPVGPNGNLANFYFAYAVRANWPAGVSSTGTITMTGTSAPQWDVVVVCFPGTVVVPVTCSMDNSAPQATLTLSESSGNSLSPTSVLCDGAGGNPPHNIFVDPSVTLTATEPADGVNSRDRFSGVTTTQTDSVCAGSANGKCAAFTFTNYDQLLNTYQATPNAQSTWDAGLTAPNVVGQVAGAAGTTGCSITLIGGGGAASCNAWFDYNRAVTVGGATIGGAPLNTQWLRNGACSFSQTSGSNIDNCDYYKQVLNTYQALPFVPSAWDVSGLSLDGMKGAICTAATSCSASLTTVHANDVIVVICYANTFGTGGGVTGFTVSGGALSFTQRLYYSNIKATAEDYAVAASSLTSVSISCSTNAGAGNVNIGILVFGVNGALTSSPYDPNGALPNKQSSSTTTGICTMTTTNPSDFLIGETSHNGASLNTIPAGFTSILAQAGSPSGAVEYDIVSGVQSGVTETWTYGAGSFSDNICDAVRAAATAVAVTGTSLGSAGQTICVMNLPTSGSSSATSCSGYSDINTVVTMGNLGVSATERWAPAIPTYQDPTGGNVHMDDYYEQLQNTYTATPNANWDSGLTIAPTGTLVGSGGSTICTISPTGGSSSAASCNAWADYNQPVSFPAQPAGCPADHCWVATGTTSFTDTTGGNSHNVNYDRNFPRSVSDAYVFSESPSRLTLLPRAASDSFSFSESTGRMVSLPRSPGDAFVVAESAATNLVFTRPAVDSFAFSDAADGNVVFGRGASDPYGFSDAPARSDILARSPADTAPFSELPSSMSVFTRVVGDSFSFLEGALSNVFFARSAGDAFAFSDVVTSMLLLARSISDTFALAESSIANLFLSRLASDVYVVTDVVNRLLLLSRSVADTFTFADLLGQLKHFIFQLHDAFAFGDSVSRLVALFRSISDTFPFGDSVARGLVLLRGVADNFQVSVATVALVALSIAVGDVLTFLETALSTVSTVVHTTTTSGGGFIPAYNSVIFFFLPLLIILLVLLILLAAYLKRRKGESEGPPTNDG